MNFIHAGSPTLANDIRGEIDLVVGRTNAGAELGNKILWFDRKSLPHLDYRLGDDTQLRALFPRVNQGSGALLSVEEVKGAAIGNVNSEANIALVGNQTVAAFETAIVCQRRINHRNFVPMDLLSGCKRVIQQSEGAPRLPVNSIQIRQDNGFVV